MSTANPINSDGTWSIIGVIDRSLFEVFLDGGARSATQSFFPKKPLTKMTLSSSNIQDSMKISVAVYALKSAWKPYENEQGIVVGNVTGGYGGHSRLGRHMNYNAKF